MDLRDRKPHKCKRTGQDKLIIEMEAPLRFVVHEHDAWRHHFDFRFMLGGALRDFVVEDGPSTDPTVRRRAISYHDHDKRCLNTEHSGDGRKGAIIIWDEGVIRPRFQSGICQEEAIWQALDCGCFEFELQGRKLKGRWKLCREGNGWWLQKTNDDFASSANILEQNRSVRSGKTLKEMYLLTVFWLSLSEFYIPDRSATHPVIVHRDGFVLDRNLAARNREVNPGLELKKAKAILQEAEFIPWEAEHYYAKQARWLDICTEFSNIVEPADQHQAWVDLSSQASPFDAAEELVRKLAQETGLSIHTGLSATKWIAQLAAHHPDSGIDSQIHAKRFIAGLHIRELTPVPSETRERLSFLGYAKIGQVADIPFEVLKEQFGSEAYVIQAAANGGVHQPVEAKYPPESCLERFAFDSRAESMEVIQNGLECLAQKLGDRLDQQNLEGTKLTVTVEYEDGKPKQFKRTFSKPIRDSRSALVGLCLLLEKELDAPITAIQALVSELRKTRVAQGEFLVRQTRAPQRLEAAIQRAHHVYGEQSIRRGEEIPIPRRVLVLREWRHATGWR